MAAKSKKNEGTVSTEPNEDTENPLEIKIAEQEEEIQSLRSEVEELKDQYLRKQADMDNYRKRLVREKESAVSYANRQIMLDIINVIDNFERAIESVDSATANSQPDLDSFHSGIVLIEKQFTDMLEKNWQLIRFDPLDEDFDPQKHEAIMLEEDSESERQRVLEVFQRGYMFRDMVLRTAKVKVSQPVEPKEGENTNETGTEK